MKKLITALLALLTLLFTVFTVEAGTRVVVENEVIKGDNVEKTAEIVTFDEKRARIDFVGADKKITEQTPYIMTVDGGENWVMGDTSEDRFYCSKMQTEEFFKNIGGQLTGAMDFFNVNTESPTIKKILEEPGPDMLGFKTTHLRIETNASAYARIFFIKFEYTAKITDDIWYANDTEIHPIRKKWIKALTQSGNNLIDTMFADFTSNLSGSILKQETVVDITDQRKKETKTQEIHTTVTTVEEIKPNQLDEVFKLPECEVMDDKEVQEKAKALFTGGKIML
jgi:hypothetical protein